MREPLLFQSPADVTSDSIVTRRSTLVKSLSSSLIPYKQTKEEENALRNAQESWSHLPQIYTAAGIYELSTMSLYRGLAIEFLGSIVFCFVHIAIVLASQSYTYPPFAIGVGHFLLLSFFILQFAASSGAHFNGFITFSCMLTGHISIVKGFFYIMAQLFGYMLGASFMEKAINKDTADSVGLGGCNPNPLNFNEALVVEFIFCLFLIFPVYGTAFNKRQREIYGPIMPPFIIGATLGLLIFSSAALAPPPFTGAGGNPTLCVGIYLAHNSDIENPRKQWVYILGPILASIFNGLLYYFAPPHHELEKVIETDIESHKGH